MPNLYKAPENLELLLEMPPALQALLPTQAKRALEFGRRLEALKPGLVAETAAMVRSERAAPPPSSPNAAD